MTPAIELNSTTTIGIICGERFKSQEGFSAHVSKHHGGVDLYDIPEAGTIKQVTEEREASKDVEGIARESTWSKVYESHLNTLLSVLSGEITH